MGRRTEKYYTIYVPMGDDSMSYEHVKVQHMEPGWLKFTLDSHTYIVSGPYVAEEDDDY